MVVQSRSLPPRRFDPAMPEFPAARRTLVTGEGSASAAPSLDLRGAAPTSPSIIATQGASEDVARDPRSRAPGAAPPAGSLRGGWPGAARSGNEPAARILVNSALELPPAGSRTPARISGIPRWRQRPRRASAAREGRYDLKARRGRSSDLRFLARSPSAQYIARV